MLAISLLHEAVHAVKNLPDNLDNELEAFEQHILLCRQMNRLGYKNELFQLHSDYLLSGVLPYYVSDAYGYSPDGSNPKVRN